MKGKTLLFAFALYFVSYFLIVNYVGIWKYSPQKALSNSDTLREAKMEKLNRELNRLLQLNDSTHDEEEKLRDIEGMVNIVLHLLCYHLLSRPESIHVVFALRAIF